MNWLSVKKVQNGKKLFKNSNFLSLLYYTQGGIHRYGCLLSVLATLLLCQKRTTDEPLVVLFRHASVGVQVVLEVGELPFDFVVRVGHPLTFVRLAGEKVQQVEVDAVHGRVQSLVRVLHLAGFAMCALRKRVVPFFLPDLVVALKGGLACIGQRVHEFLECMGGLELQILGEVMLVICFMWNRHRS